MASVGKRLRRVRAGLSRHRTIETSPSSPVGRNAPQHRRARRATTFASASCSSSLPARSRRGGCWLGGRLSTADCRALTASIDETLSWLQSLFHSGRAHGRRRPEHSVQEAPAPRNALPPRAVGRGGRWLRSARSGRPRRGALYQHSNLLYGGQCGPTVLLAGLTKLQGSASRSLLLSIRLGRESDPVSSRPGWRSFIALVLFVVVSPTSGRAGSTRSFCGGGGRARWG